MSSKLMRLLDISGAVFFSLLAFYAAWVALVAGSLAPALVYLGSLFAVAAFIASITISQRRDYGEPYAGEWRACLTFAIAAAAFILSGLVGWLA